MYLYLFSILISAIITYLIKTDLKIFNIKIYEKITPIIWFKLYSIITIGLIHLIWIFNILFDYFDNDDIFYGIPNILIIPYIIYIFAQIYIDNENETIVSEKINVYLNYLISIYFLIIIVIISLPSKFKIDIIDFIKINLYKMFPYLFIL